MSLTEQGAISHYRRTCIQCCPNTARHSHNRARGSHNRARGSHNRARGSHNRARGSHNRARGSHTRVRSCCGSHSLKHMHSLARGPHQYPR